LAEFILVPAITDKIIMDGFASVQFSAWMDQVTEAVKPPLVGSGSPESVVIATIGRWYVDTDSAGTGVYLKNTGEGNTGWIARS
jgi:hypothetical protein